MKKNTPFWSILAMIGFYVMVFEFAAEFHYLIFKDFPHIIENKAIHVFTMCKTAMCMAFLYGVWKGYI